MFDLATLADSCCVYQRDRQTIEFDHCVCRVARRTGDGTHNRTFFSDQLIQQTGLARVRFPDDSDLDAVIFLFRFLFWEGRYERVEQIACSCPMHSGDRVWLT